MRFFLPHKISTLQVFQMYIFINNLNFLQNMCIASLHSENLNSLFMSISGTNIIMSKELKQNFENEVLVLFTFAGIVIFPRLILPPCLCSTSRISLREKSSISSVRETTTTSGPRFLHQNKALCTTTYKYENKVDFVFGGLGAKGTSLSTK